MSNRTYSSALNDGKGAPDFGYIYDPANVSTGGQGQLITGNWRPYSTSDISNTQVNVSGLSLTVGAVAVTGNPQVTVSNALLGTSGVATILSLPTQNVAVTGGSILTIVTGTLGGSVTVSSVAVTGIPFVQLSGAPVVTLTGSSHVTVDNTSPMPISGVVQAQVTIGNVAVTGLGALDATHSYLPVSGINFNTSVSVTSVGVTGGVSGSAQGNLDLTRSYLPTSGVGIFNVLPLGGFVGITGTVSTNASVTVGAVAITGVNSGSALGNLDVTRTYLGVSGINPFAVNATLVGGSVNVVNSGGYVAITGTANTVNVGGYVGVTGVVATNDTTGNLYLLAISGLLATNLNAYVPVSGTQLDLQRTYTGGTLPAYSFLAGGGRAVNLTGLGLATGYNTGDYAIFSINRNDGSLLTTVMNTAPVPVSGVVNVSLTSVAVTGGALSGTALANLDLSRTYLPVSGVNTFSTLNLGGFVGLTGVTTTQITGWNTGFTVTVQPASSPTTSASSPSGTAPFTALVGITGIALNANPNRIMCFVQNIHTGLPLYVQLGAGTAGTGNFSMILNPSANLGWGGDSWSDDHFRGRISCSGGAWNVFEL